MKMGNIVLIAGLEPTSLPFWTCVLHHVTTIPTPTCLCSSLPQRPVHTTTIVIILTPRRQFSKNGNVQNIKRISSEFNRPVSVGV